MSAVAAILSDCAVVVAVAALQALGLDALCLGIIHLFGRRRR